MTSFGSDIVLWTIPEKFFISSEDYPSKLLVIDRSVSQLFIEFVDVNNRPISVSVDIYNYRVTSQATVEPYKHQIPSIVGRKSIAGLLGVINLVSGPHLVVAQSKIKIGHLTAYNHIIWRLDGVSVLPFARSNSHLRNEQNEAANEQRKMVSFI